MALRSLARLGSHGAAWLVSSLLAGCGGSDATVLLERGQQAAEPSQPSSTPEAPGTSREGPELPPAPSAGPSSPNPATDSAPAVDSSGFEWNLPRGFPLPLVPADNPMTAEKVELGRHLFYDRRLSGNETMSCASCHEQRLAFSDGLTVSVGATGQTTPRNAMSLTNVAYAATLTWAHPYLGSLERQAQVPMFGDAPVELGLSSQAEIEARLRAVPIYQELFALAFPEDDEPITLLNLTRALASFQRTLLSGSSAFDDWLFGGQQDALGPSAQRGFLLFNSEKLECFHCHLSFNLSDQVAYQSQAFPGTPFHNTGLYNIDGSGGFPEPNTGVHDVTRDDRDMGKFKAPTLRNIAVTGPYMHDGSIATLSEVLDHYAAAGRTIADGPYAGDGSKNPHKDPLIRGFTLTEQERADVLAFLESLTDTRFLENPAFSDPWPAP